MDRRQFLRSSAKAVGASLLVPAADMFGARSLFAETDEVTADVVMAKGGADVAVKKALGALGSMKRFIKPDQVVVVKPNASFSTPPEMGATTHPDVVKAVLDACFDAGARRALVVDHTLGSAERCFKRTGMTDVVAGYPKAKLVSLDKEKAYREIEVPDGKVLKKVKIPAVMQKVDLFINLPTAKSHSATAVSLGLKNLMGLIWDRQTFHQDFDLHQGVADLATVLKPQLTIIDALEILKTGGPSGPGEVESFGGVVAGVDPVAVDAYGVGLSTWNRQTLKPDQVNYLRYAAEHGVGTLDLSTLRVVELS